MTELRTRRYAGALLIALALVQFYVLLVLQPHGRLRAACAISAAMSSIGAAYFLIPRK